MTECLASSRERNKSRSILLHFGEHFKNQYTVLAFEDVIPPPPRFHVLKLPCIHLVNESTYYYFIFPGRLLFEAMGFPNVKKSYNGGNEVLIVTPNY